ncbi:hypothetical protein BuS5_01217 [Desulfosarcina sp. BuS5]|nr:hypothetical protein BuS5_01217 [Desulfosarcina sp. BuS5]
MPGKNKKKARLSKKFKIPSKIKKRKHLNADAFRRLFEPINKPTKILIFC